MNTPPILDQIRDQLVTAAASTQRRRFPAAAWSAMVVFALLGLWAFQGGAGQFLETVSGTSDGSSVPITAARTSSGGNELIVTFHGASAAFTSNDPCYEQYRVSASESDDQIELDVTSRSNERGRLCPAAASPYFLVVQLSGPVGARPLVDGATDQAIPLFDGDRVMEPQVLPDGYSLEAVREVGDACCGSLTWRREFEGPSGALISISQGPPLWDVGEAFYAVVDHVMIRDIDASVLRATGGELRVVLPLADQTVLIDDIAGVLNSDELVAVAEGLRPAADQD